MKAFIRGCGLISPQETFARNVFPEVINESSENRFRCLEPSYLDFVNPVLARRMGRVIKMGIASAMICMKDAKLEMPDAIIAGTALGCLGETEKFLKAIIADDEQYLTPTSFIQSLQNSVSAQIALHLNCTGHNFTFAHKGFSFESALLDSLMMIGENDAENILVGGIDEMTDHNYFFYNKLGHFKKEIIDASSLLQSNSPGSIGGEGAAFFLLSKNKSQHDYAELLSVKTVYSPADSKEIELKISELLIENNLTKTDVDLVLYGLNGDNRTDHWYYEIKEGYFQNAAAGWFKHLCGEYQTSGGFAMWTAAMILKSGKVPESIFLKNSKVPEAIKNILIYNSYDNNHSLLLLRNI